MSPREPKDGLERVTPGISRKSNHGQTDDGRYRNSQVPTQRGAHGVLDGSRSSSNSARQKIRVSAKDGSLGYGSRLATLISRVEGITPTAKIRSNRLTTAQARSCDGIREAASNV